jgi:outer membrane immunogenic protein
MPKLSRWTAALSALLLITSMAANAADMYVKAPPPAPVPPPPSWTGFYIGANGGWGWSSFDTAFVPDPNGDLIADGDLAGPSAFNTRTHGGVFGGQIGYNWQIGNWVLGVEGDFDAASISGTQNSIGTAPNSPTLPTANVVSVTQTIDWLASIRGRIGAPWGPGLLYFTGGGAWEGVKSDQVVSSFGDTAAANVSSTRSGFVIGGGYEWQFAQHWNVRGEYLFYDFAGTDTNSLTLPDCNLTTPGTCNVALTNGKNNISVGRIGMNYRF